jgi:hypothetical protein
MTRTEEISTSTSEKKKRMTESRLEIRLFFNKHLSYIQRSPKKHGSGFADDMGCQLYPI